MVVMVLMSGCKDDDDVILTGEVEPNGTFATASPLTLANTADAKISPALDVDYFVVTATSDVAITIDGDVGLELYVYVYDENQIQIYGGGTGARGASMTYTMSSSDFNGKFYIKTESAYPDDTGDYTIGLD